MNIGIAQIKPVKGNIMANMEKHIQFVNTAVSLKASSIFFPELSLTGYEPELAKELAIQQNDSRLEVFQKASDMGKITIGVGVPTIHPQGLQISMLIFQPKKPRILYSKQQLHEDEFPYFENGDKQILITVENQKIIPAICFESLQTNHADKAVKLGGQLYVASKITYRNKQGL